MDSRFSRFRHEVHSAEDNDFGIGFGGLPGQTEEISNIISNLLDWVDLIIMAKDYGIGLFLEPYDFLLTSDKGGGVSL